MPSDGERRIAMRRRYRQTRRAGFSCRVRKPDSNSSSTGWWWCGANGSLLAAAPPRVIAIPVFDSFLASIGRCWCSPKTRCLPTCSVF